MDRLDWHAFDGLDFGEPSDALRGTDSGALAGQAEERLSILNWVSSSICCRLVLSAVESPETEALTARFRVQDGREFQSKSLLALLTCSYAMGLSSSSQIERALWTRSDLCYLSPTAVPDGEVLKAFRRQSRPLIHCSLVRLFKLAWVYRFVGPINGEIDWELSKMFLVNDWFHPDLCDQFERIATERIRSAMAIDSAEADV